MTIEGQSGRSGIKRQSPKTDIRDMNAYATQPNEKAIGVTLISGAQLNGRTPTNCARAFWTISPPTRSRSDRISAGLRH